MMELVIVLPIYLVLFGGLIMLGDTLIRTIRLPSAERTHAFDVGRSDGKIPGWDSVRNGLFNPDHEVSDMKSASDDLKQDRPEVKFYADTEIEGPFSVQTATKVRDDYSLPGGVARGQLAFANRFFGGRWQKGAELERRRPRVGEESALYSVGGRLGVHSKADDVQREYTYNYYTLKRHRYNPGSETSWRDNGRKAHELLTKVSNKNGGRRVWEAVLSEGFHAGVSDDDNSDQLKIPSDNPDEFTVMYERYNRFVTWSE